MIQRQQSLWLALSTISSFFTYKLPFYTGTLKDGAYEELDGANNFFLLVLTGISLILSLVTIFLFKDRKLQLKLAAGGAALALLILILYFSGMKQFLKGSLSFTCIFAFAVLVGYIMAARGIWKDEKLVKSLDKLR
jgi:peptidoglycan/LPS O-acetylase OafA/YrhL